MTARETEFELRGEHITLDALLKATGLAASGGGAKQLVASGKVQVDGQMELRRGCKLRVGQVAAVGSTRIRLTAAAAAAAAGGDGAAQATPKSETPPNV